MMATSEGRRVLKWLEGTGPLLPEDIRKCVKSHELLGRLERTIGEFEELGTMPGITWGALRKVMKACRERVRKEACSPKESAP